MRAGFLQAASVGAVLTDQMERDFEMLNQCLTLADSGFGFNVNSAKAALSRIIDGQHVAGCNCVPEFTAATPNGWNSASGVAGVRCLALRARLRGRG